MSLESSIQDTVKEAINANKAPRELLRLIWAAWSDELKEKERDVDREFKSLLQEQW